MTKTGRTRVGDWEIIQTLGSGGNGVVFLVRNSNTNQPGAMKELIKGNDSSKKAFKAEILNAAKISNLPDCPIMLPKLRGNGIYSDASNGVELLPLEIQKYYYVMDYHGARTLGVSTRRELFGIRLLSLTTRLTILGSVAEALTFLHKHHITHNDVKPDNIVLDKKRSVGTVAYLVDYGSTRRIMQTKTPPLQTEQYEPPDLDTKIEPKPEYIFWYRDLYAFAITAYEILSGGAYPFGDRFDLGELYISKKAFHNRDNNRTWTTPPSRAMSKWLRHDDYEKLDDLFAKVFDYRRYEKNAAPFPISGVQDFWEEIKAVIDNKSPVSRWVYLIGVSVIAIAMIGIAFLILNTRQPCDSVTPGCLPTNTVVITGNLTESWSPTPIVTATSSATTIPTASATHESTATQLSPESFLSTLAAMSATPFATTFTPATEMSTSTPANPVETVPPTPTATDSPTATTVPPSLIPSSTSTLTPIPPTLTSTSLPPTFTTVQPTVTATDTRVVPTPVTAVRLEPANGELVSNGNYRMCREQIPSLCDLPTFELNRYGNAARVDDPVVGVSWRSAQNYCLLAGGRLPTAEEMLNLMQATSAPSFREWILPLNTSQELFASPEAVEAFEGQATAISANGEIVYSLITNSTEDTVFRCIPNAP